MQVKLSDIASYKQGKQVDINDQFSFPFANSCRFIRIVDYTNDHEPIRYVKNYGNQYMVSYKDLVMIRYGSQTAGKVVRGYSGIIANNMFKIEFKENINLDYMYYYLSRDEIYNQLRGNQSSSTMPAITFSMMDSIVLRLHTPEQQQHIVDTIGSIDDLIENYNKINVELYHLLDMVLLKEPSTTACLGDYINLYDNIRKPLSNMQRKGEKIYPYYGATEIIDYVDSYLFDGEYILMAEDGSVINSDETAVVQFITGKSWVGNHAHVIQPKNKLNIYSLYIILKNTNVKTAITGAVQLKINQENLRKLEINIPSNIDTFNQICEKAMRNILNTKQKILELNKLKQSYLNKYFK